MQAHDKQATIEKDHVPTSEFEKPNQEVNERRDKAKVEVMRPETKKEEIRVEDEKPSEAPIEVN